MAKMVWDKFLAKHAANKAVEVIVQFVDPVPMSPVSSTGAKWPTPHQALSWWLTKTLGNDWALKKSSRGFTEILLSSEGDFKRLQSIVSPYYEASYEDRRNFNAKYPTFRCVFYGRTYQQIVQAWDKETRST